MKFSLGDIGTLVGIFSAFVAIIWFIFDRAFFKPFKEGINEIKNDFKSEKNNTQNRRESCDKNFGKFDTVSSSLENIENKTRKIDILEYKIDLCVNTLSKDSKKNFAIANSPKVLTNLGKKVLDETKAKQVLEQNIDFFITKIEEQNPKTALDVENTSLEVLQLSLNEDFFEPVKNHIYNNPNVRDEEQKDIPIGLLDICFVMSLPLRDKYLEKHAEISPE